MMSNDPKDDFRKLLQQIMRDVEGIGDKLDDGIARVRGRNPMGELPDASSLSANRSSQRYARAGATSIELTKLQRGRVKVLIDKVHAFVLTPRVAEVLGLLIEDAGVSDDQFVPFKGRDYLRTRLGNGGIPAKNSTLNNLIHRLRREMKGQTILHPDFIQVNESGDYRFALLRGWSGDDVNG